MKLADKNSATFLRVNDKKAEGMQKIEGLKTEIAELETQLSDLEKQRNAAQLERVERDMARANSANTMDETIAFAGKAYSAIDLLEDKAKQAPK